MNYFRIKNWKKHQHYSDRRPPWIKLHNSLFDDYGFQQLTDIQRWHLVAIWLIASRSTAFHGDGDPLIPEDEKYIARQTGMNGKIDLNPLYSAGFLIRYQDDSNTQAKCSPETEAYKSIKEEKETYSEFVKMLPSDYQKLIAKFGEADTKARIERLNNYIGSKGKKYSSHYHTILNWAAKETPSIPDKPKEKLCACGKKPVMTISNEPKCRKCAEEETPKYVDCIGRPL